jgi:hypothetical protein
MADQLTEAVRAWVSNAPPEVRRLLTIRAGQNNVGADGKVSKQDANYRKADGEQRCDNCSHWQSPSGCEIVAGKIVPDMVSDYWEAQGDAGTGGADASAAASPDTSGGEADGGAGGGGY